MREIDDEPTHADAAVSRANTLLLEAAGLKERAGELEAAAANALASTGLSAEEIVRRQVEALYAEADAPNVSRERSTRLANLASRLLESVADH